MSDLPSAARPNTFEEHGDGKCYAGSLEVIDPRTGELRRLDSLFQHGPAGNVVLSFDKPAGHEVRRYGCAESVQSDEGAPQGDAKSFSYLLTGSGAPVADGSLELGDGLVFDPCGGGLLIHRTTPEGLIDGVDVVIYEGICEVSAHNVYVERTDFAIDSDATESVMFFLVVDPEDDAIVACGVCGSGPFQAVYLEYLRAKLVLWDPQGKKKQQMPRLCAELSRLALKLGHITAAMPQDMSS